MRHGRFTVVDKWSMDSYSTKKVLKTLGALNCTHALLSDVGETDYLYKSSRNINGANSKNPQNINAEDVLRYKNFVISEEALEALNKRLGGA